MTLPEQLKEGMAKLLDAAMDYIETSEKFQKSEEAYKLVKAKIMNMDRVANLPNQSMREAEVDTMLQNDERFAGMYREYLENKTNQKTAWIMFDTRKELTESLRTLVNNLTFGKDK